jgi:hypothetical protein
VFICNGSWEYRPDFTGDLWRRGASTVESIGSTPDGLTARDGQRGRIVWNMKSPYVFVGGRIEAEGAGARFFISFDGKAWREVKGSLDSSFPEVGAARYEYQLKCELERDARLRRLAIMNDVQMAPLSLPEMVVGENAFTYSDQSTVDRRVRITHLWVERSASRPPLAPSSAVSPVDGGEAQGTDLVFQWTPATDPDGDPIGDYQFELSSRGDMRFPLSMCFHKLISRTGDLSKGKAPEPRYTLVQPGLLTPDRQYYWHVRAMDKQGVWGPWSKNWSFTPRGPANPLAVTVEHDLAASSGVLRWRPNPIGRPPVKYRVYGSSEKGFTISDQPFQGTVGVTKAEMAAWNPCFPANFIAETRATELKVLGSDVADLAANKTYYRVVAVDEYGKRSGSSDYATAPRPVIFSRPVVSARMGAPYRYQLQATCSLGDLSARMRGLEQVSGNFDIEKATFTLQHGPPWLKLDAATGVLSGTPDGFGKAEVIVSAAIDREIRRLDEKALAWGNEKVLSTTTMRVGSSTQHFVIDVQPR